MNISIPYPLGYLEAHTYIDVKHNHPQETLPHTASKKSIMEKIYIPDQYQVTAGNESSLDGSSSHLNTSESFIKFNDINYSA